MEEHVHSENCDHSHENSFEAVIASLGPDVRRRVNALRNLQDEHAKLETQLREEILALDKKYLALYQPLYDKRAEIIGGKVEPTDAEATRDDSVKKEEGENTQKEAETEIKGIPKFWLTVLNMHPGISELITERDEEALEFLTDIKTEFLVEGRGFKLDFHFAPNKFFTNTVLTKTYFLEASPDISFGDVVYDHAEGTKIEWNEDMDLSVKVETKKQRHKATNKTRTVKKVVPTETFFNFFNPPKAPEEEDGDFEDVDALLEADYEIGEIIKEKLIPRAIDWFTGRALEYEEGLYDDEDTDEDEFDQDLDDDDDDDDDDDNDDESGAAKPKGRRRGKGKEQPPECKQQ